jgi:hypothetical protein
VQEASREDDVRITVYITPDQDEYAMRLDFERKRARQKPLGRSAIIRALLEGMYRANPDTSGIQSEADLATFVEERLGR